MILTKAGSILGPIATVLGYIMDILFRFTDIFGIFNVGLCIILFTIVMKTLMIPLTIKQQKTTKLMSVMNPEIQAIQKKYKGKTDNESLQRQNVEVQAVYEKYGTSMTGGCLPLLIQMPILFALYRVIYNIPAYVPSVRVYFDNVVIPLMGQAGYAEKMQGITNIATAAAVKSIETFDFASADKMVDLWVTRLGRVLLAGKGYTAKEMKHTFPLIAADFANIPVTRVPKVKVGVVGEIYVKYSPLGNNDLQKFLESQDCEVNFPGLMGFVQYCAFNMGEDHVLYGGKLAVKIGIDQFLNWLDSIADENGPATTTECMLYPPSPLTDGKGWGDRSHPDTAVAHLLTGFLLGVEPLTPGFGQFKVEPHACTLTRAEGIIPTPYGKITAAWRIEDDAFTLEVTHPKEITPVISTRFVSCPTTCLVVNGCRLTERNESLSCLCG